MRKDRTLEVNRSPQHRVLTPPAPALTSSSRVGRVRRLFTNSSGGRSSESEIPYRRRSVRFQGQVDGQHEASTMGSQTPRPRNSTGSSWSQRLSEQIENIAAKLNSTGEPQTIVHRTMGRSTPKVPFLNTQIEDFAADDGVNGITSPSTISSLTRSAHDQTWSPASTASTAATSWASPRSSGPKFRNHQSPDESKGVSAGNDDSFLAPIQEDSGRVITVPVMEREIVAAPSITTVENVAAAKVYFETKYQDLLLEPSTPRSLRRRKLRENMEQLGLSHDERMHNMDKWRRTESEYLRQVRVLKTSAIARHRVKGISIAGYDVIRVLGKGSFGVVRLVTDRKSNHIIEEHAKTAEPTNGGIPVSNVDGTAKHNLPTGKPLSDVFAMKVIRKSDMLRACQEGHLRAERDFLVNAEDNRWVVPLIASFQDNTNLYLVMEFMVGGDFLGLLLREDVLDEDVAK